MTIKDRLLAEIRRTPGADDDELARRLGVSRQQVNQRARRLVDEGLITRTEKRKIQNFPT
ncbi:MAG: helix-turn-helix domain-containing protein [Chloroflexota bacterium]|nr:helix-turn-helix domain-containing protein [Chloroflexota bacterium]